MHISNSRRLLSIHFIVVFILFILYFIDFISIVEISDAVLISIVLIVFLWVFFSSKYIGLKLTHPYRLYLLIFFLYSIGGFAVSLFYKLDFFEFPFGDTPSNLYTKFIRTETLFSIIFFMAFFHLGVLVFLKKNCKPIINVSSLKNQSNILSKKTVLIIFYISLLPAYYYYFVIIKEAYLIGGYQEYVASEVIGSTQLPVLIRISKDFFIFSYWLYASTIPEKRQLIIPTILYILPFLLLSIFTGSRVSSITQLVALLVYFTITNYITRKSAVILLSIFILFSVLVGIIRSNQNYDLASIQTNVSESQISPILDFVLQQGASAHTISLTIASIDNNSINHSLRFLIEPLYGTTGYQPGKNAGDYFYLADRLSYQYLGGFSLGSGLGSSIVAEFYVAGGLLGVIIFSFLYGFLLFWLLAKINKNFWFILLLLLLPGFYYTPRAHPLTPLLFAKNGLILLMLVTFLKNLTVKKT